MAVDSDSPGPSAAVAQQPAALGGVSPRRANAVRRTLLEWAASAFPSADEAGEVQRLLDLFLAQAATAPLVAGWAAEPGDIQEGRNPRVIPLSERDASP